MYKCYFHFVFRPYASDKRASTIHDSTLDEIIKLEEELVRTRQMVNQLNMEIGPREVDSVSSDPSDGEISEVEQCVEQNDKYFASNYNYTTNVSKTKLRTNLIKLHAKWHVKM